MILSAFSSPVWLLFLKPDLILLCCMLISSGLRGREEGVEKSLD